MAIISEKSEKKGEFTGWAEDSMPEAPPAYAPPPGHPSQPSNPSNQPDGYPDEKGQSSSLADPYYSPPPHSPYASGSSPYPPGPDYAGPSQPQSPPQGFYPSPSGFSQGDSPNPDYPQTDMQAQLSVAASKAAPRLFSRASPPNFSVATHRSRCLAQLRSKGNGLEKYIYLNGLKERDHSLFYSLLYENMPVCPATLIAYAPCVALLIHSPAFQEMVPILYTPTVGDACQNYSHIWRRPEGMYVSIGDKGRIREVLSTWPNLREARIAVVTDGSRILGLGDLGANGLPISIGKLDLYIAGAGIRPTSTVPICLDLGTNTEKYLNDPHVTSAYAVRVRMRRRYVVLPILTALPLFMPITCQMDEFMTEFMEAMREVFPNLLVQFEDFSTDNAFKYLDRFRNQYKCFNDDIQGTGAVVLSGFLNAARISSQASGRPLSEHRILFFGAGSAGIGVAKQLLSFFKFLGMSEAEAKKQIWTVDSKGLITADRKGLQEHKKFFARTDYEGQQPLTNLVDIINHVKPTALLGLSTLRNAFTKEVVDAMVAHNPRPILFPLSNPVALCEIDYEDAIEWTDGKVIFASGSPYRSITREQETFEPGQGNNMYVFPGIGLGSLLSKASRVTDTMIEQASIALAGSLEKDEHAAGLVYPRLDRIRDISARIALAVIRAAQNAYVDNAPALRHVTDNTLLAYIKEQMWNPPENGPASLLSTELDTKPKPPYLLEPEAEVSGHIIFSLFCLYLYLAARISLHYLRAGTSTRIYDSFHRSRCFSFLFPLFLFRSSSSDI
ncbi:hypothetical protein EVG20_g10236 [Dentipellis fragilis]|uniref:Malic enzyme n=1 Tax=Dentipellis fragilis TaxID=205917 RepID=A0A4Y9XSZ8_9AGAM|nr:hypothetical protein EVG20_g10236 [Dentipellis fragilis]